VSGRCELRHLTRCCGACRTASRIPLVRRREISALAAPSVRRGNALPVHFNSTQKQVARTREHTRHSSAVHRTPSSQRAGGTIRRRSRRRRRDGPDCGYKSKTPAPSVRERAPPPEGLHNRTAAGRIHIVEPKAALRRAASRLFSYFVTALFVSLFYLYELKLPSSYESDNSSSPRDD
jgi:hypothetical protein